MAHPVDIFLQPGKVFEDLRERPRFALPLLLLLGLSAALPLWYFLTVDTAWYAQHMLLASGREASAQQLEQAKAMMSGTHAVAWMGGISAAIVGLIATCLYALYLMLAGKVLGHATSFKRGMSLVCWSNMPSVLGIVVALVGVATMRPHTPLESLMLTNVDPLLVQLPADSPWFGLARGFSLLSFWTWFLLALGWRTFNRAGWLQSAIVALLPSVVIYGAMAAFAFSK
jgi:hypothetical protein